MDIGNAHLW